MTNQCNIYFIEAGKGGPVKIGRANFVAERLRDMQVGNHLPLKVVATYLGTPDNERALHRLFDETKIRGEWFERTAHLETAMEKLDRINADAARAFIAKGLQAKEAEFQRANPEPPSRIKNVAKKGPRSQGALGRGWTASV